MIKFSAVALLAQQASASAIDYAYISTLDAGGAGILSYIIPAFVPPEKD